MKKILVLNTGSSSLKYAVFNHMSAKELVLAANGVIANIGNPTQQVKHVDIKHDKHVQRRDTSKSIENHKNALKLALDLVNDKSANCDFSAVGHRVVHGGEKLHEASLVNNEVIKEIKKSIPLAPLHNPHNLRGIETAMDMMPPNTKHVAVFDTGFHSTIPQSSYLYGLPYNLYKHHGIRKYGFHGINHEFVVDKASEYLNIPVDDINIVSCHIGAGCSVCCIKNGRSIDTSMGMTPLEGLIMATRCGDIDPNVIFYLTEELNFSLDECKKLLQNQSGWYGISGHKDAISLNEAFDNNDKLAVLAVKAMVHRIEKYIGAYYWQLEGKVDAIVFTGGLGENWSELRLLCLEKAKSFGFIATGINKKIDNLASVVDISSSIDKKVLVIRANEELNIARKITNEFS